MRAGGEIFWYLFDIWNIWAAIVCLIVAVWLFHHSLKYRSTDGSDNNIDDFKPGVFPRENDDLKMELTWTIVPFILIVYLTYIAWGPIDDMWSADPDAHEISVTGNQWYWDFDCDPFRGTENAPESYLPMENRSSAVFYDENGILICEITTIEVEGQIKPMLRVKAEQSYGFLLTSNDVTHAPFFLDWGIKEDAQPGMQTRLYHTPSMDEVGSSLLMCTEYCGKDHGYMTAVVEVFV
ncbi:MAG: Cytochrome c oxidase subunit 2 [Marine Group II euryarchaeote MED-G33]|nr:MAG: Cytochrome c oxidase subunit 2 [Marine Group II euryarchaeote MED-G33]